MVVLMHMLMPRGGEMEHLSTPLAHQHGYVHVQHIDVCTWHGWWNITQCHAHTSMGGYSWPHTHVVARDSEDGTSSESLCTTTCECEVRDCWHACGWYWIMTQLVGSIIQISTPCRSIIELLVWCILMHLMQTGACTCLHEVVLSSCMPSSVSHTAWWESWDQPLVPTDPTLIPWCQ